MEDARLLELAISGLQSQRDKIDEELAVLRGRIAELRASKATDVSRKSGRKRTAAQKKAHSERMRKIWADRKKAKK
jgi:hypothetical protein